MSDGNTSVSESGVPPALEAGTPMQKISSKKIKQVVMRINDECITWAGSNDSKSKFPSTYVERSEWLGPCVSLRLVLQADDAVLDFHS
jgi:hypothetical protein